MKRNMRIGQVVFVLSLICAIQVQCQESVTQVTSPASMRWFQINTNHFRILYPAGFEKEAQRVANTFEHIREPEAASLEVTPKKISIVLHSQSATSNGFVTLAPRRSEFFAMPPQNYNFIGNNDWLTLLSSHEYRHIVQFQKSKVGFNKAIYFLFGQLTQAGMAFVAVPQWFWEGDAVATETAFTHSGRGRIPEFDLLLRTNFLEGRKFSYNKQYLRSYKDNVPDHYVLGYHMVSYLRKKTGNPDVWSDITKRAWSYPFIPFTFSSAIKKETGLYVTDLYKEMAKDVKQEWEERQKAIDLTPFEKINQRSSETYTDYSYPQQLSDGSIVVLKAGIGDISQFVRISENGKENKLFVPGPLNDAGMLSADDDKLVWNEYRYDPRWQTRSYSVIRQLDVFEGKTKGITHGERYAAASISPDGTKVATVETDRSYGIHLLVVDRVTGDVIKRFENGENSFISMPRWNSTGEKIVFIKMDSGNKSLVSCDYETGEIENLFEAGKENAGHPVLYDDYLFYNSPVSGIDNIYAINLSSKTHYQVTSSKYGAYNPSISEDGKTVFYNDQSGVGLDVVKIDFDPSQWKRLEEIETHDNLFSNVLAVQEGNPDLMQNIPVKEFQTRRYHRAQGMINPHTWGPYTTSSFNTLDIGISSKDVLSTTVIDLGYRYDAVEKNGFWRADFSYQGFYPIIDVGVSFGNRSGNEDYTLNNVRNTIKFDWKETKLEAGLRIPLVTTHSKYSSSVSLGNYVGITKVTDFKNDVDGAGRFLQVDTLGNGFFFSTYLDNGQLLFNRANLDVTHLLKRSRRDINSRWGQVLSIDYLNTPFQTSDFKGELFSALAILYFPGIMNHHSFWGYGGYQRTFFSQRENSYLFRNQMPSPRGHSILRLQDYYIITGNYTLPLWYPDIAIGPLLNIQRIRANAFFDYAYGERPNFSGVGSSVIKRTYTSIGGELKMDFNVMRLLQQFNIGVRYSYPIETQSPTFEVIIGNIGF